MSVVCGLVVCVSELGTGVVCQLYMLWLFVVCGVCVFVCVAIEWGC